MIDIKNSQNYFLDTFHGHIIGEDHNPKLVFLHGLLGAAKNWLKIIPYLKEDYQVLAYDQRGHGRSKHLPINNTSSLAPYIEDLKNILDDLCWQKIHLVGHSMGGIVATEFANQYQERISSLTVGDMPMEPRKNIGVKIESLIVSIPTPFKNQKDIELFFHKNGSELSGSFFNPKLFEAFLKSQLVCKKNDLWDWRFDKESVILTVRLLRKKSFYKNYFQIKAPILVIRGKNSEDLNDREYQKMLSHPQAKGVVLDSGHWVHIEQPFEFAKALKKHIQ